MNFQNKSGNTTKRVGSPVNGDYGMKNQGGGFGQSIQHQPRNTQNNFFQTKAANIYQKGNQNQFNQTVYNQGFGGGFGQKDIRNKSNGGKLQQYGGHGNIQTAGSALGGGRAHEGEIDQTNISPQEVAAFYANAINAKQIINSRRINGQTQGIQK